MYLYFINKPSNQESIAELECLMLTGAKPDNNFALSDTYVDIMRSAYLDMCIEIYFVENDISSLYSSITSLGYDRDRFRVKFLNTGVHIDFKTRKEIESRISDIFPSVPDLKNPVEEFIVTKTGQRWMFGKLTIKNENRWLIYGRKPYTFCNALPSRMARALVNMGTGNHTDVTLIDPCCGVGTVLLEALDIGIDACGIDINEQIVKDANRNLNHFGFESRARLGDAAAVKGKYDISIVDLPYGVLSKKGSDRYSDILSNVRRICSRAVILSGKDISDVIEEAGFRITEGCIAHKGGLDRHIAICE